MAFNGVLSLENSNPLLRRAAVVPISLALHTSALGIGVAMSLWKVEELNMPPVHVTLGAPPPLPSPPPARRVPPHEKSTNPAPRKSRPLQQPEAAQPQQKEFANSLIGYENRDTAPEEHSQDAPQEGVDGSQGTSQSWTPPPPPPTSVVKVVNVAPQVAAHLLLINPSAPGYRVNVPPALLRSGVDLSQTVVKLCANARGVVTSVAIVQAGIPAIDAQIPGVLRRWRYRPMHVSGQPVDFCYVFRYDLR